LLKEFHLGQKSRLSGCFSPNGKLFAAASDDAMPGSDDGTVAIWDVATGKEIKRFVGGGGSVAFSPDRRLLASGGGKMKAAVSAAPQPSGRLRVWDWASDKVVLDKTGIIPPRDLVFSRDGQIIVTSGNDPHISVWNLGRNEERTLIHDWPNYTGLQYAGFSGRHPLAFIGNGQLLASGGGEGTIRLWDLPSGKEQKSKRMSVSREPICSLACAGSTLAVGGADGVCQLWDAELAKEKLRFDEHRKGVRTAVSKNGAWIATGSGDGTIRLWKGRSGEFIRQWMANEKGVNHLCFGPDDRLASDGAEGTVRVWDIASAKELGRLIAPTKGQDSPWIFGLQFSGDGRQLLVGRAATEESPAGTSAEILIWDWQAAKEAQHSLSSGVLAVAATHDFKEIVASTNRAISLHNAASGALVLSFSHEKSPAYMLDDQAIPLAISPDGGSFAAACNDQVIRIWDLRSPTERFQLVGQEKPASCLCYSADGRLLAAAERGGSIVIWELASGQPVYRLVSHPAIVNSITFTPDGRRLVTGSDDTTALIWSLDPADAVPGGPPALNDTGLNQMWTDLGSSNASLAYWAAWRLSNQPATVAFLGERLKPAAAQNRQHINRLIGSLDDSQFMVREQATRELEELGDEVGSLLRQAAANTSSAEVKRRLEGLIAKAAAGSLPAILRDRRAVAVLEQIGTKDACDLLGTLAKGAPDAAVTRDATSALTRHGEAESPKQIPPK
jgi:WD40 repeat protein